MMIKLIFLILCVMVMLFLAFNQENITHKSRMVVVADSFGVWNPNKTNEYPWRMYKFQADSIVVFTEKKDITFLGTKLFKSK